MVVLDVVKLAYFRILIYYLITALPETRCNG